MLDEATSVLDNCTGSEVIAAIETLDKQLTVIMIAHRLSTEKKCDKILAMGKRMHVSGRNL